MIRNKKILFRKDYFLDPEVQKAKERMLNSEYFYSYGDKIFRNKMFMKALKMVYPKVNLEVIMLSGFMEDEDFIIIKGR